MEQRFSNNEPYRYSGLTNPNYGASFPKKKNVNYEESPQRMVDHFRLPPG